MKIKKCLYFLLFIFLFILVSNYLDLKVYAVTETYEYNGMDYTFTYENISATAASFRFDRETGLMDFDNIIIEISYADKSYIISGNQEKNSFYLSDLSNVEEFYTQKDKALEIINDENLYNVDEEREYIIEELANVYYDVGMSIEDNKSGITSMYSSFVANVMMNKKNIFSDLTRDDLETIKTLVYATYDLNENGLDSIFVSDLGYEKAEDYTEDINYKIMFDENREYTLDNLKAKIRHHDSEDIYSIIDDAVSQMSALEYYPNSDDMYALYESLCNSLYDIQAITEESILFFQERIRFYNYFSELYEKAKSNNTYDEDGLNALSEFIQEYNEYVDGAEEYSQVVNYKQELIAKINTIPIKQIESEKGKVSVDGTLSSDATLTITEAENKGNSDKAYDISIDASDTSDGNTYNVEIYDVDLRYADIEVYRIYNGKKVNLHSEYVNNCLRVETDTLGTIYVAKKINAPWGQMAIVFGVLFSLLIGTIIFFSVDGKKHERRI